jgi:hypothetical protein
MQNEQDLENGKPWRAEMQLGNFGIRRNPMEAGLRRNRSIDGLRLLDRYAVCD